MRQRQKTCSFCGKSQFEVKKLISGPTVFICNECVDLCLDIIHQEKLFVDPVPAGSLLRYEIKIRFDRPFRSNERNLLPALVRAIQTAYPCNAVSLKSFDLTRDGGILSIYFDSAAKITSFDLEGIDAELDDLSRLLKIAQENIWLRRVKRNHSNPCIAN